MEENEINEILEEGKNNTTTIKDLTPTELLKSINDCQKLHDRTKTEMIDMLFEVEALEHALNEKSQILTYLEKQYVDLIEELDNRKPEGK